MDPRGAELRSHELLNALTAIKTRAQVTRRRVLRIDHLSRTHIAADLVQIDAQVSRLAAFLHGPNGALTGPRRPPGGTSEPPSIRGARRGNQRQESEGTEAT